MAIFTFTAGSQSAKINIGETGIQNPPDLEVSGILDICITYSVWQTGNQQFNVKMVNRVVANDEYPHSMFWEEMGSKATQTSSEFFIFTNVKLTEYCTGVLKK